MSIAERDRAALIKVVEADLVAGADRRIVVEELAANYNLSLDEAYALAEDAHPSPPAATPPSPRKRTAATILVLLQLAVTFGVVHKFLERGWDLVFIVAVTLVAYIVSGEIGLHPFARWLPVGRAVASTGER
jgi:hypothetical protein